MLRPTWPGHSHAICACEPLLPRLLCSPCRWPVRRARRARTGRRDHTGGCPAAEQKYLLERVDDAAIVQLYADGFSALPLNEKRLVYHLTQAAIAGRDIYWDQRYRHGLAMRGVLEQILTHSRRHRRGHARRDHSATPSCSGINTGPYNNLTARKFVLTCTPEAFAAAAAQAAKNGATFATDAGRVARGDAGADASALLRRRRSIRW